MQQSTFDAADTALNDREFLEKHYIKGTDQTFREYECLKRLDAAVYRYETFKSGIYELIDRLELADS